jgi:membrane peptidoglycan carboxypeptidase
MLDAAMQRRYAANPDEGFFTGGGLHHFVNFEPEDNRRTMTVSEALTRSVNLVFIRLMRDVVRHVMARDEGAGGALLDDASSPQRHAYLARFADMEGREFVARFYRKHARKPTQEAEGPATRDVSPTPPGRVRVHPLERWVEAYLDAHPTATLDEAIAASAQERQAAYQWLFSSRRKAAQDSRIRSVLEADAFAEILKSWRRLGYPFESLTPSYATALGASGDRPASLAELMGLIVNRGVRLPVTRVAALTFARGTPYETRLAHPPGAPDRVLAPEIADVVRHALIGVVEDGTAKRLKGALVRRDGSVVEIGGKTGTGDHRFDTYGPGGKRVSSRVVDRSATLVFFIGERYFGTMMAYVHEPYASKYKFTSALPAQLLKVLTPVLRPLVDGDACSAAQASSIRIDSVGRARLE